MHAPFNDAEVALPFLNPRTATKRGHFRTATLAPAVAQGIARVSTRLWATKGKQVVHFTSIFGSNIMFRSILGILSLFRSFWGNPQWEDEIAGYPSYAPQPTDSAMSVAHGMDIHSQREFLRVVVQLLAIIQHSAILIFVLAILFRFTEKYFLSLSSGTIVSAAWNWGATIVAVLIPLFLAITTSAYELHYRTKLGETFERCPKQATPRSTRGFTQWLIRQVKWFAKFLLLIAWILLLLATVVLVWPYVSIVAGTAKDVLDLYMSLLLESGIHTIP